METVIERPRTRPTYNQLLAETQPYLYQPTVARAETSYAPPKKEWQTGQELQAFGVGLYYDQYHQIRQQLQDPLVVRDTMQRILQLDSYGVMNEAISAQKYDGKYVFDSVTRIKLQMTPPEHKYVLYDDGTMAYEEHAHLHKDVLDTLSTWRRSLDRRTMEVVKDVARDAKVGESIIWHSPKAAEWEDNLTKKYNGEYGFLYKGEVIQDPETGLRQLLVHDYKNDLPDQAYQHFFKAQEGQVFREKLVDTVLPPDHDFTTVVKVSGQRSDEAIWHDLADAKHQHSSDNTIFNLTADEIIQFQDRNLHQRIKNIAAAKTSEWLVDRIIRGDNPEILQDQVAGVLADALRQVLHMQTGIGGKVDSSGLREISDRYSGSFGDGCGKLVSSFIGESKAMSAIRGKDISKGKWCMLCNEQNLCTESCYKCGGMLSEKRPRHVN